MVLSAWGFDGAACAIAVPVGLGGVFVERRINEWRRFPASLSIYKVAAVSPHFNVRSAV
jgi:hypothetical protein